MSCWEENTTCNKKVIQGWIKHVSLVSRESLKECGRSQLELS